MGDAGFQRFFAQSRRGDTDGAATMRAAWMRVGRLGLDVPRWRVRDGRRRQLRAPAGLRRRGGRLLRDASCFEIWALKKVFAAAGRFARGARRQRGAYPAAVVPRPTTHAVGFGDSGARFRVFGAAGDRKSAAARRQRVAGARGGARCRLR